MASFIAFKFSNETAFIPKISNFSPFFRILSERVKKKDNFFHLIMYARYRDR